MECKKGYQSRNITGDKRRKGKENTRKTTSKLDEELKKANIRGTNNEQMIKGLMKIVSTVREHLDGLHKMVYWAIYKILILKVDSDKQLPKPSSEFE